MEKSDFWVICYEDDAAISVKSYNKKATN